MPYPLARARPVHQLSRRIMRRMSSLQSRAWCAPGSPQSAAEPARSAGCARPGPSCSPASASRWQCPGCATGCENADMPRVSPLLCFGPWEGHGDRARGAAGGRTRQWAGSSRGAVNYGDSRTYVNKRSTSNTPGAVRAPDRDGAPRLREIPSHLISIPPPPPSALEPARCPGCAAAPLEAARCSG